jgi:hypothetical protein
MTNEFGRYIFYQYWGGLGDILYLMMHDKCRYNLLSEFGPNDRAHIVLTSPNYNAREIFDCHPNAGQVKIVIDPWVEHIRQGVVPKAWMRYIPPSRPPKITDRLIFHPTPKDQEVLDDIGGRPYIVVAPTAAGRPRCFPDWLTKKVVRAIVAHGALPVFIGASYKVHGHYPYKIRKPYHGEPERSEPQVFSAINRLTVPGSIHTMSKAAGIITCYSAMCVGAFTARKRQLVMTTNQLVGIIRANRNHLPCLNTDPLATFVRFQDPCVNRILDDYVKECMSQVPQPV